MSFVPPLFGSFGTKVKDLFSKQYDYKNELKTKNAVAPDLTIESGVVLGEAQELSGNGKVAYKPKFGSLELEGDTKGTFTSTLKLTELYKDLTLILKGSEKPAGKVTAEYKTKALATSAMVDVSKNTTKAETTVAVGYDGLSLGLQGLYNIGKSAFDDYNAAIEYSAGKDYTATVKTTDKAEKLQASFIYFKNAATQVGSQGTFDIQTGKKLFAIGAQYDFDGKTLVKSKIDTDGIVGAVLEHKLANPQLKLQLSSSHNIKKGTAAESFGVGLVFGDF